MVKMDEKNGIITIPISKISPLPTTLVEIIEEQVNKQRERKLISSQKQRINQQQEAQKCAQQNQYLPSDQKFQQTNQQLNSEPTPFSCDVPQQQVQQNNTLQLQEQLHNDTTLLFSNIPDKLSELCMTSDNHSTYTRIKNENSESLISKEEVTFEARDEESIQAIFMEGQWFALDQARLEGFQRQNITEIKLVNVDLDEDFLPVFRKYFDENNLSNNMCYNKTNRNRHSLQKIDKNPSNILDISNCSGFESNSSNCSSVDNGSSGSSGNSNNNANISAGSSNSSSKISLKSSSIDCKSNGSDSKSSSIDVSGSSYHTVESRDRYDSCLHDHIDSVLEDNDAVVDDDDGEDDMSIRNNIIIKIDRNDDGAIKRDKRDFENFNDEKPNKTREDKCDGKYVCFQYDKNNHNIINKNNPTVKINADNDDEDDDDDEEDDKDETSSSEGDWSDDDEEEDEEENEKNDDAIKEKK